MHGNRRQFSDYLIAIWVLFDCKLTKDHRRQLTAKPFLYPDCPALQTARGHYGYQVPHHWEAHTRECTQQKRHMVHPHDTRQTVEDSMRLITWTLSCWSRWAAGRRRTTQVWRWLCLSSSPPTKALWEEPGKVKRLVWYHLCLNQGFTTKDKHLFTTRGHHMPWNISALQSCDQIHGCFIQGVTQQKKNENFPSSSNILYKIWTIFFFKAV